MLVSGYVTHGVTYKARHLRERDTAREREMEGEGREKVLGVWSGGRRGAWRVAVSMPLCL